jgi:hypothetical protein
VLHDCLVKSGVELSHIQSHARHIPLDTRALIDMHFSPLGNAPLDADAIGAAEAACGQQAGSAHITSSRSFYVACSVAAALPALAAHPLSPDHRMSSFEAAAVCAAAARPASGTRVPSGAAATAVAAHVAEKTARSWVREADVSQEVMAAAAGA